MNERWFLLSYLSVRAHGNGVESAVKQPTAALDQIGGLTGSSLQGTASPCKNMDDMLNYPLKFCYEDICMKHLRVKNVDMSFICFWPWDLKKNLQKVQKYHSVPRTGGGLSGFNVSRRLWFPRGPRTCQTWNWIELVHAFIHVSVKSSGEGAEWNVIYHCVQSAASQARTP